MKRTGTTRQEEKEKTPAWIVSFADMTTLLLAFFVLLQVFARMQDPELFRIGRGSFRRAISGLGLPNWLLGRETWQGEHEKKIHPTEEGENAVMDRVIDPRDDRTRQIFDDLKREIEAGTRDTRARSVNTIFTPIRFPGPDVSLDSAAQKYLADLAADLGQNLDGSAVRIVVVGLAPDQPAGKDRWLLSARRAKVAEALLRDALSEETSGRQWELRSWGVAADEPRRASSVAPGKLDFIRITIVGAG